MTHAHFIGGGMSGAGGCFELNYRRTEADRRPPRQVVTGKLMGDPSPTRMQDAEAAREHVQRRIDRMSRMGTYQQVRQQQSDANRATIIETLERCGAMLVTDLIRKTGIHAGAVGSHVAWLEREGKVRRTASSGPKGVFVVVGLTSAEEVAP